MVMVEISVTMEIYGMQSCN